MLKHDSIEQVDHVDLDVGVIEACKEHFSWGKAWDDPRVKLHIADGAAFVKQAAASSYDVIIQDSSDPWTTDDNENIVLLPSSILYTKQHFVDIHRILTDAGVFNFQAETFNIPSDLEGIREWWQQAQDVGFKLARYGSLYISSYPTGQIGFLLCEKNPSEAATMEEVNARFEKMQSKGLGTTYYQPNLQERYVLSIYHLWLCHAFSTHDMMLAVTVHLICHCGWRGRSTKERSKRGIKTFMRNCNCTVHKRCQE